MCLENAWHYRFDMMLLPDVLLYAWQASSSDRSISYMSITLLDGHVPGGDAGTRIVSIRRTMVLEVCFSAQCTMTPLISTIRLAFTRFCVWGWCCHYIGVNV